MALNPNTVSSSRSLARALIADIHARAEERLRSSQHSLTGVYTILAAAGTFPEELQHHLAVQHLEQYRSACDKRLTVRLQRKQQERQQQIQQQQQQQQQQNPTMSISRSKKTQTLHQEVLLDVVIVCGASFSQLNKTVLVEQEAARFDASILNGTNLMASPPVCPEGANNKKNSTRPVRFHYKALPVGGAPEQRIAAYCLASKQTAAAVEAERKSREIDVEADDSSNAQDSGTPLIIVRPVLFVSSFFLVADILNQRLSPLVIGPFVLLNAHRAVSQDRFALSLMQPRDAFEQAVVENMLGIKGPFDPGDAGDAAVPRWGLCLSGVMSRISRDPCLTMLNPIRVILLPKNNVATMDWFRKHQQQQQQQQQQGSAAGGRQPSSFSDVVTDEVAADPETRQLLALLRRIFAELVQDLNGCLTDAKLGQFPDVQALLDFFAAPSAQQRAATALRKAASASSAGNAAASRAYMQEAPDLISTDGLLPAHAKTLLQRVVQSLPLRSRCRDICESLLQIRYLLRLAPRVDAGSFLCRLQCIVEEALQAHREDDAFAAAEQQQQQQQQNPQFRMPWQERGLIVGGGDAGTPHAAPLLWLNAPSADELLALCRRRVFTQREITPADRAAWQRKQEREAQDHRARLVAAVQRLVGQGNIFELFRRCHEAEESCASGDATAAEEKQALDASVQMLVEQYVSAIPQQQLQQMPDRAFTIRVPPVCVRLRELVAKMLTRRSAAVADPRVKKTDTSTGRGRGVILIVVPHTNDGGAAVLENVKFSLTLNRLSDVQNAIVSCFAKTVASGRGGQMSAAAQMAAAFENMASAATEAQKNIGNFGAHQPTWMAALGNNTDAAATASASNQQQQQQQPSITMETDNDAAAVLRGRRSISRALNAAIPSTTSMLFDEIPDEEELILANNNRAGNEEDDDDVDTFQVPTSRRSVKGRRGGGAGASLAANSVARSRSNVNPRAFSMAAGAEFPEQQQANIFSDDLVELCTATFQNNDSVRQECEAVLTQMQQQKEQKQQQQQQQQQQPPQVNSPPRLPPMTQNNLPPLQSEIPPPPQQQQQQQQQQLSQRKLLREEIDVDASGPSSQLDVVPQVKKEEQSVPAVAKEKDDDDDDDEVVLMESALRRTANRVSSTSKKMMVSSTASPAAVTPMEDQKEKVEETKEGGLEQDDHDHDDDKEIEITEEPIHALFATDPVQLELHSHARIMRDGPGEMRVNPAGISARDGFFYRMHAALDIVAVSVAVVTPALLRGVLNPAQYLGQRHVVCVDADVHLMRCLELFNVEEALAAAKAAKVSAASGAGFVRVTKLRTRMVMEQDSPVAVDVRHEVAEETRNVQRLSQLLVSYSPASNYRSTQPLMTTGTAFNSSTSSSSNSTRQGQPGSSSSGSVVPNFSVTSTMVAKIPTVLVDHRELRAELAFWLHHERGLRIVPLHLDTGDYIVSGDVAIERKAIPDLFKSINEKGRSLYNQLAKMQSFYKFSMVLVEMSDVGTRPAKTVDFGRRHSRNFTKENLAKMLVNVIGTGAAAGAAAASSGAKGDGIGPIAPSARQQISVLWSTGPRHSALLIQRLKLTMGAGDPVPVDPAVEAAKFSGDRSNVLSHGAREILARMPGCGFVEVNKVVASGIANNLATFARCTQDELATVLSAERAKETWEFLNTPLHNDDAEPNHLYDSAPVQARAGAGGGGGGGRGRK